MGADEARGRHGTYYKGQKLPMSNMVPQKDLNKQNVHFRKIILIRIRKSGAWI